MSVSTPLDRAIRLLLVVALVFPGAAVQADEASTLTSVADATLKQGTPTTNDGSSSTLQSRSESTNNFRAVVRFDLSSIDVAAAVKTSFLQMKVATAPLTSRNEAAHRITGAPQWTEAGVTWNTRDGATSWTTAGGDFDSTPVGTQPSGTTSGATLTWTVRSDGTVSNIPQGWLDGSVPNRGLLVKDVTENDVVHAVVKGVQSGTATSSANGTVVVPITAVDPTKSFLIFQSRHNSNRPPGSEIRGRIATSTTLEFVRVTDGVAPEPVTIAIQWYVVEFSSGVNVQRGEVPSQNATTINVPITPVAALNQAFVLWSKTPAAGDQNLNQDDPLVGELTSTTNLQFRVNTANAAHIIWWQVIEFTNPGDINAQKGSTSMLGTALSSTVTLGSAVDVTRTFVLVGFQTSGTGPDVGSKMLRAQLTNSTTITIDRSIAGTPDDITEIVWQAVELKDGSRVQHGSENFAAGTAQKIVPISSVDTNRAVAFASVQPVGGQNMGRSPFAADDIIGVGSVTMALGASQITMDRNNTAASADIGWFVVEFAAQPVSAVTYGSRESVGNEPKLEVHFLRNVSLSPAGVGISEVTLNWTFPFGSSAANYDGLLFARRDGVVAPSFAPADGTSYVVGSSPLPGETIIANTASFGTTSIPDENGADSVVLPNSPYSYKAYTHDGATITGAAQPNPPHYSFGVSQTVTTLAGGGISKNWSYKTGAATLAPPGLDPGATVVTGSNDGKVHSMSATNGGRKYQPVAPLGTTGGAIQSRPPLIPSDSTTVDCDTVTPGQQPCDAVYVGAGDGKVYAFNATTGAKLWESAVLTLGGGSIQGGAAVQVKAFSNPSFTPTTDLVIVGTRNVGAGSDTNNRVVALNGNTGATVWTFSPGNLDIINSTPFVGVTSNVVWVTSRAGLAETQPSLWKLDSNTGSMLESFSLGSIDGSPTMNDDGKQVYAVTNAGSLFAVRTDIASCTFTASPGTGTGVGFPIPGSAGANADNIFFSTATTVNKVSFTYGAATCTGTFTTPATGWTNPTISSPSTPVHNPPQFLYVGSSDGRLYKIDPANGAILANRVVNLSATVGDPSFDVVSLKLYVGDTSGRIYSFDEF